MSRWIWLFFPAVVIIWGVYWLVVNLLLGEWPTRGQYGDMFGAVNALFSGLAFAGVAVLRRVLPADIPRIDEVGIDGSVLAFTAIASVFAGVLFGLYPALRAMRPGCSTSFKTEGVAAPEDVCPVVSSTA
ncbi:MAG: hypothetical protein IIC36_05215 [Gemmatimonadetes bacterium]|nr:hypothetical protein [Gemmatimonadota bacterium]